jgi:hypothetical protein
VTVFVPQLSVVSVVLSKEGTDVPLTRAATWQAGTYHISAKIPWIQTGTYSIQAVVTDGVDIVRTGPRNIRVAGTAASPSPSLSASPTPSASSSAGPAALGSSRSGKGIAVVAAVTLIGSALLGGAALLLWRRRSPRG